MNHYLPGMEPDFELKQTFNFINGVIDLRQFDKVVLSISGGKDSHAMLFHVLEVAETQGVKDRLQCMYADTGMEWHNAESHVRILCQAAAVPLKIVYPVRPMLEKFQHRMASAAVTENNYRVFPSPRCRFCTSDQKLDPMDKFIRSLGTRQNEAKILQITGERWAESASRSTLPEFGVVDRLSTHFRKVFGWRPMLKYSTEDVFSMIKSTPVARHECYDMGCKRLGCAGCIFSSDREIKIELENNPHIFEALDKLEIDSGFTMSMNRIKIRDRVK